METFDTIIGQTVKLQGNLTNQGSIQINGSVEGEIESGATVIVGASAIVHGPIKAKIVEVSGEVHGNVSAGERIEIQPKGKIYGDALTRNLVIKLGALFVGKSDLIKETGTKSDLPTPEK